MEILLGLLGSLSTLGSLVGAALGGVAFILLPEHFPRIEIAIGLFVLSLIIGKFLDLLILSRKK